MTTYLGTASGATPGIQGNTTVSTANGVKATTSTSSAAVLAASSGGGAAAHGYSSVNTGYGLYGETTAVGSYAGYVSGDTGVWGVGTVVGVYGVTSTGQGIVAALSDGVAIKGQVTSTGATSYAVFGASPSGAYCGYFDGLLYATSASSSIKAFVIDHPLDPANKVLRHSSVESADRKNLYDGIAVADAAGEIVVQLPAYFTALNADFRYQLTAVGASGANLYVKEELVAGRFVIAGAAAGCEVCWQVTGSRKDPFALANPMVVEEDKPAEQRGRFLTPEAHGQPKERGMGIPSARPRPTGMALIPKS